MNKSILLMVSLVVFSLSYGDEGDFECINESDQLLSLRYLGAQSGYRRYHATIVTRASELRLSFRNVEVTLSSRTLKGHADHATGVFTLAGEALSNEFMPGEPLVETHIEMPHPRTAAVVSLTSPSSRREFSYSPFTCVQLGKMTATRDGYEYVRDKRVTRKF